MIYCQWATFVLTGISLFLYVMLAVYWAAKNNPDRTGSAAIGCMRMTITYWLLWGAGTFSLIFK